ncbi:MAG TPA: OpgC domain-containing protein [Acetobacteraceae bacterium]|nr:OpgC domain-containing protein [Acetobacteraceae bacterium]
MTLIRRGGTRDLRVDFFRGLALWWIFTDHTAGDVLGRVSLTNFAMCDATEIFVLLAGYGAGLAYGLTMLRQGYLYAAADAVKRAWTLYIAHIFLFVVYTAQVAYSAVALDRAYYLDEARLDVLGTQPYEAMLQALLLRFQPNFLNILPLYVVLLLMFAVAMPLLRRPALLLGASFALYVITRATGLNFQGWTGPDWYFDPFAWQFLFMIGAVLSYAPPNWPRIRWPFDIASILVLLAGVLVIWVVDTHPPILAAMPSWVIHFVITQDKTGMYPFRLVSILSLLWLVARTIPRHAAWLDHWAASPFILMGQNSLPVFCFSIFFGFFARMALEYSIAWPMQTLVNVAGAITLVSVGAVSAWYRAKGRAPRVRAVPAPLPVMAGTDSD